MQCGILPLNMRHIHKMSIFFSLADIELLEQGLQSIGSSVIIFCQFCCGLFIVLQVGWGNFLTHDGL